MAIQGNVGRPAALDRHALALLGLAMTALDQSQVIQLQSEAPNLGCPVLQKGLRIDSGSSSTGRGGGPAIPSR